MISRMRICAVRSLAYGSNLSKAGPAGGGMRGRPPKKAEFRGITLRHHAYERSGRPVKYFYTNNWTKIARIPMKWHFRTLFDPHCHFTVVCGWRHRTEATARTNSSRPFSSLKRRSAPSRIDCQSGSSRYRATTCAAKRAGRPRRRPEFPGPHSSPVPRAAPRWRRPARRGRPLPGPCRAPRRRTALGPRRSDGRCTVVQVSRPGRAG